MSAACDAAMAAAREEAFLAARTAAEEVTVGGDEATRSVPRGIVELARLMLDKALLSDPHHSAAHCHKGMLRSAAVPLLFTSISLPLQVPSRGMLLSAAVRQLPNAHKCRPGSRLESEAAVSSHLLGLIPPYPLE